MQCDLTSKKCVPCRGGVPPLKGQQLTDLAEQLGGGWKVVDEHHLQKEYKLRNFREALDLTNQFGQIAEEEGHHPDLRLSWGKLEVMIYTHKIDGLTESDFILAAKYDQCFEKRVGSGGA